jgi:hypothetical protein
LPIKKGSPHNRSAKGDAKRGQVHATFFKHARSDPDDEREFDSHVNMHLLLFSITGLSRMGEPLEATEITFLVWVGIQYPDFLREKDYYSKTIPSDQFETFRSLNPWDFFEMYRKTLAGK